MIEQNLIDVNVVKNISSKYFAHYKTKEENHEIYRNDPFSRKFIENYEELSRNNWELHKKYVKEGHNPNELAQIIRNDEIEKLQEISSQSDFDFNQIIEPSLYERCSYVNHENVTLIDYAAFFSAVKCFKYLLMNNANVENTGKYAVAGGNLEIIHLCEQNHLSFEDAYKTAIEFHRNDVFKYIYENKTETSEENFNYLAYNCINSGNYEILGFLEKEAVKINEYIINESARSGNLYLVKDFLQNNQIPKDILCFSSKSGNLELVKYILEQEGVDINAKDIYLFHLKFVLKV